MNKYKLIFLSLLFIFFGTIFFYGFILSWNTKCDHLSTTITIDKGYSVNDVSRVLENNLCINSTLFKIAIKMTFNEKKDVLKIPLSNKKIISMKIVDEIKKNFKNN